MSTNKITTDFPDDENDYSSQKIFQDIRKAARELWTSLDPTPVRCQQIGHMTACNGKQSLRVGLSYKHKKPNSGSINLQAVLADNVRVSSEAFQDLLWQANAAYPTAKVRFDRNLRLIVAQANSNYFSSKSEISEIVQSIYVDFDKLLNDDCLYSAIVISKARFLGTPLDIWSND